MYKALVPILELHKMKTQYKFGEEYMGSVCTITSIQKEIYLCS